jgi:hypothetical protein
LCHWTFADPLTGEVPEPERVRLFEKVFWQIVRQVSTFIELPQYAAAREGAASVESPACVGDAV